MCKNHSVLRIDDLKIMFHDSNRAVVCMTKNQDILYINTSAKGFFLCADDKDSKINGKNFLDLCSSINCETINISDCEEQYKYKNWKVIPIELKNFPAIDNYTDTNTTTIVYLVIGVEIDEKLIESAKIKAIKNYYENIIALMPGHVYWIDKDGVYLGCNDQQAKSAGLKSRHEIVNKTNKDLPWNSLAVANKIDSINQEVMNSRIPITIEEPGMLNDQEAIFLSKKHVLCDSDGNVTGMLGISFDITERKKAEKLLKKAKRQAEIANQLKSDFLACMSHDLRTPLNCIYGAIQILQMNLHYAEQVEYFESISKSAFNLLTLVEDILNFAKLESGKIQLRSEYFNMRKLLEEVVILIANQANQKGLKLIISYCDSVPRFIISDPHAIRRILINLISNAIKFTESGHILISVDLVEIIKDHATIQITIEDTGIGIPKDKINYIFDRFSKVNPSYNSLYSGCGLGLSIVKKLIEGLNGTINVNSQLSCGSTFWCTLPVRLQQEQSKIKDSSRWQKHYNNVRVLVVDDYDVRAKNIVKQLASISNIRCRSNEALHELQTALKANNLYQIIVIDDEIIFKNHIQIAESIRKIKAFDDIMLILFGSPKTLSENEKIKKAGFFKQLIKPVQPEELSVELSDAWEAWQNILRYKHKSIATHNAKVLLVEDDIITQKISIAILEHLGCKVDTADNGSQALNLIKLNCKYDFIFIDIGLPDLNGIELTKRILKSDNYNNAFIVGLTAHAFEENRKECLSAGMSKFITKPVSYIDFKEIIDG